MMRSARSLLVAASLTVSLGACTPQAPTGVQKTDPGTVTTPGTTPTHPDHASVPGIAASGMPLLATGDFTLATTTAPGTASFTDAVEVKEGDGQLPPSSGTASFSVTVDGTAYAATAANALYMVVPDDAGAEYIIVGAFQMDETTRKAQVVYVVVKKSDYAPGATITLDGTDRMAMFGSGNMDSEGPDVMAIATSGTFTFSGGSPLTGGLVGGTLTADFAKAEYSGDPTNPGQPTIPGTPPAAGTYTLTYGGQNGVECRGTLAGQEAAFAALTAADLGFIDGTAAISGDANQVTLSGSSLVAGYGSATLVLGNGQDGGPYLELFRFTTPSAGPLGTKRESAILGMDTSDMSGFAAAHFVGTNPGDDCTIGFDLAFVK